MYYIHYCNLHISKRLNVSQVGILWYIDSSRNFLFFNELHLLFGIFLISFGRITNWCKYLQCLGKKLNEQVPIWNGQKGIRIFTKKSAFECAVTDSCPISANLNKQITLVSNNKYSLKKYLVLDWCLKSDTYRMRAILTSSLYIFYPIIQCGL